MSHILKNRLVMTRLDVVIRFLNIAGGKRWHQVSVTLKNNICFTTYIEDQHYHNLYTTETTVYTEQ